MTWTPPERAPQPWPDWLTALADSYEPVSAATQQIERSS